MKSNSPLSAVRSKLSVVQGQSDGNESCKYEGTVKGTPGANVMAAHERMMEGTDKASCNAGKQGPGMPKHAPVID